ncbi:uncharacterized protein [Antedon mediterranea]|uniref:uncharacterized protein n=1 Tax=Antedon mediterranea TaxID=105859 RepID=UPI003AF77997
MYSGLVRDLKQKPRDKYILSKDRRMLVATVDKEGATLTLGMISLTIPEGALPKQTYVFIYNLGYMKTDGKIPLCPEVMCGPEGLTFDMYVTLRVELYGNVPENVLQKPRSIVSCKQENGDWTKMCKSDGTAYIKNNKSCIIVNHFTKFKTELDQANDNCSELERMTLLEINACQIYVHGRHEVHMEVRKVNTEDPGKSLNSEKQCYCNKDSEVNIIIDDRTVPLHNYLACVFDDNLSSVKLGIPVSETTDIHIIDCIIKGKSHTTKLNLSNTTRQTNFKKPQTNVIKDNMKTICAAIEKSITPAFKEFLYKDFDKAEKDNICVELAVTRYLNMNDNDFRKLEPHLRSCGMVDAADKVNEITAKTGFNNARRSLPTTSDIQPLSATGGVFRQGVADAGFVSCGPGQLNLDIGIPNNEEEQEGEEEQQGDFRDLYQAESLYQNGKWSDLNLNTENNESSYTTYVAKK